MTLEEPVVVGSAAMSPPPRTPRWACREFTTHGAQTICAVCSKNFERQGNQTQGWDLPPRAKFGRGWFSVGATHFFDPADDNVFDSRDGKRLLAQAVCGGLCDVTFRLRAAHGSRMPEVPRRSAETWCADRIRPQ